MSYVESLPRIFLSSVENILFSLSLPVLVGKTLHIDAQTCRRRAESSVWKESLSQTMQQVYGAGTVSRTGDMMAVYPALPGGAQCLVRNKKTHLSAVRAML